MSALWLWWQALVKYLADVLTSSCWQGWIQLGLRCSSSIQATGFAGDQLQVSLAVLTVTACTLHQFGPTGFTFNELILLPLTSLADAADLQQEFVDCTGCLGILVTGKRKQLAYRLDLPLHLLNKAGTSVTSGAASRI